MAEVLSVSQITALIKGTLEADFPRVLVEGEISNWRPASSGHLYFSLKDKDAMLQAVMFRGKAMGLRFDPADGMKVRASGSISVYPARGAYQIVCDSMETTGEGEILAMLEERKRRLAAEGLFDASRKRPISPFPRRVAVITSPTGAAVRDILTVLSRRAPQVRVVVLPAAVQGADAPGELINALTMANEHDLGETIIIGRGGGSLEDLLAFSDEDLARAVAASRIPVISAVGHEIDWSLCDLAADLRAPTPSAAAELAAADREETLDRVKSLKEGLVQEMRGRLSSLRERIDRHREDELEYRFRNRYQPLLLRLDDAKEALLRSLGQAAATARHRWEKARALIEASNPTAILKRGYAIVRKEGIDEAITASSSIHSGDRLRIRFASGSALATTEEVIHEEV